MALSSYSELVKRSKKNDPAHKKIKLAILADSSTQFLVRAIKGAGFENQISFEIYEADQDQVEMQVFDDLSDLYKYNPDFRTLAWSKLELYCIWNITRCCAIL